MCNLLEEVIRMYGMKANGVNDIYSEGKEVLEKAEKKTKISISAQTGTARIPVLQQPKNQGNAEELAACCSQTTSPIDSLNNFY